MKKRNALLMAASLAVLSLGTPSALAEEGMVYGTASLTYAEFYAGDVSSVEGIDAVTSATVGKSGLFPNVVTDFVDEATNKDGYHVTGVANVNVAVPADQLEAYKAINPTFVESETEPAQYKPVNVEGEKAVYGATVFQVADTVTDAELEVVTDSHWGDYQINVHETSTTYIRNTREDGDFAVNSQILGAIVETESGLKVGMEHLQSLWVQPYEISWNVSVDNSHNTELAYDNLSELDKLMGEKVTKVTFINANEVYEYVFDGAYLPIKFVGSLSVENAAATAGSTAVAVTGLPEDYEAVYSVEGLEAEVADHAALNWKGEIPGAYTLLLEDAGGVYAKMTADFVLSTDVLPVAFDAETCALVAAEGSDEAMMAAFLKNLSTVVVNETEYRASGRGAVAIIDADGLVDLEAVSVKGRGEDAVTTPVFGESGEYTLTVNSTGFETPLTFTVTVE